MEGPLSKWTNVMKGWQYRWFVLDSSAGLLSYYTSKEKMVRGSRRGCVRLKGAVLGIDDEDDSTFTITVDGKVFHFQARDAEERERWLRGLEDTILRHQQAQEKWSHLKSSPTIHDFDLKLTEADAYLQILINEIKDLDNKIEQCVNTSAELKCIQVKERANIMLESIKHTIVLLQIAKNTAFPSNGVYQPVASVTISPKSDIDSSPSPRYSAVETKPELSCQTGPGLLDSKIVTATVTKVEAAIDCLEPVSGASSTSVEVTAITREAHITPIIPEVSYSSSEDEDYFDAAEFSLNPLSGARPPGSEEYPKTENTSSITATSSVIRKESHEKARRTFLDPDGQLDYDALYEDDSEEDIGSMESQGSVISHLVSQVKIGMDLTKVVLPTFILERRSLLEMYADFFAHPDLFVRAVDCQTPQERMTQIVRWYLSAFHAGRKTSVAKKPYNPILGEVFKCHWDVPGYEGPADTETSLLTGVTTDKLCFVSEQVSHHPPISAFYAEHYNKRISCCAHIWTKSKFLGLSIGVHMIGQGCISLLDYDEEYILTFPNGYGRSILTVPWVELGGSVTVSCAKTGFTSQVEFITKPFYGGKKHRLTAELYRPNEKKPYLTVEGEWNGVMMGKWETGRSEVFVDTKRLPIVKKKVRPVIQQEVNESRRLWKDVTAGLRLGLIDDATEAKLTLEQKQRAEAKQRLESGTKWETLMFHESGGNWLYDQPLHKRLSKKS